MNCGRVRPAPTTDPRPRPSAAEPCAAAEPCPEVPGGSAPAPLSLLPPGACRSLWAAAAAATEGRSGDPLRLVARAGASPAALLRAALLLAPPLLTPLLCAHGTGWVIALMFCLLMTMCSGK